MRCVLGGDAFWDAMHAGMQPLLCYFHHLVHACNACMLGYLLGVLYWFQVTCIGVRLQTIGPRVHRLWIPWMCSGGYLVLMIG